MKRCLEREVEPGASHPEIIVGPLHNIPAEIVQQAEVRREANFETASKLANGFALTLIELSPDDSKIGVDELTVPPTSPDSAAAHPKIGCKARAANRKPHGKGTENTADRVIIIVIR